MKLIRNLWLNHKWHEFSNRVKSRDGYRCLQCQRSPTEVVLQVHHEFYIQGKAPWEYALSDCRTLCKGCHAREHGLIEPDRGWTLLSIDDLGGLDGICEREGCGSEIRYEHLAYHPKWGYIKIGSTCVEHLTKEDKLLCSMILKEYNKISKFVHDSEWRNGRTKNGKPFLETVYNRTHKVRIYGNNNDHSFQIVLKSKGVKFYKFDKTVPVKGKNLEQVKELAYIALKGKTTNNLDEKEILRKLYRSFM